MFRTSWRTWADRTRASRIPKSCCRTWTSTACAPSSTGMWCVFDSRVFWPKTWAVVRNQQRMLNLQVHGACVEFSPLLSKLTKGSGCAQRQCTCVAGGNEAGAVSIARHRVFRVGADGVQVPRHPRAAQAGRERPGNAGAATQHVVHTLHAQK